jgi:hypothetical protein
MDTYEGSNTYISGACEGEKCTVCGHDATHKVEEAFLFDDPDPVRHPLTAYVYCEHFQALFGRAAKAYCARNGH